MNGDDPRLYAPAVARNREPIWKMLQTLLPQTGSIVEVASGSGEHIVWFAQQTGPRLTFQPSDPDTAARASIDEWVAASGLSNVMPALALDAAAEHWPIVHADMILCINMIHIAPWAATVGLMKGAARTLSVRGRLFLYGPFKRENMHTCPSNAQFDEHLRGQNSEWGVRDLESVRDLAESYGLKLTTLEAMPANNLVVVFERTR